MSRGKVIQKAPVAWLVMIRKCLTKSSLQPKMGTKSFTSKAQDAIIHFTSRPQSAASKLLPNARQFVGD